MTYSQLTGRYAPPTDAEIKRQQALDAAARKFPELIAYVFACDNDAEALEGIEIQKKYIAYEFQRILREG